MAKAPIKKPAAGTTKKAAVEKAPAPVKTPKAPASKPAAVKPAAAKPAAPKAAKVVKASAASKAPLSAKAIPASKGAKAVKAAPTVRALAKTGKKDKSIGAKIAELAADILADRIIPTIDEIKALAATALGQGKSKKKPKKSTKK